MKYKIVSDSSSNVLSWDKADYVSVPLKIISSEKEYVDDINLDVAGMVEDLKTVKGKVTTSCPNGFDWTEAYEGAENVFAITLTSRLSGCYNSARLAAEQYMAEHEGVKIFVIDSLSTGGEMKLIIEKLTELFDKEKSFEEIVEEIGEYQKKTHLAFSLESLTNLARNGRVSPAVAAIAGVLGIRVIGIANDGVLDSVGKARGEKKAICELYAELKKHNYNGGKVRISHCLNEEAAEALKGKIIAEYPSADVEIIPCGALCSFYAEMGGLLVGYEG